MEDITLIYLITGGVFILFVIGVPIILCIAYWVLFSSLVIDFTISNIGVTCYHGISSWALLAMPLFILTGDLISAGGIARQLIRFAQACLSYFRGALAMATVGACGIFAAISGSNSATTAAIGGIMIPEMKRDGYDESFAACTAAAGGTVGILIPPSIVFVIYGFLMNVCISDLFLAGIIPGILTVIGLIGACSFWARRRGWGSTSPFNLKKVIKTFWGAKLGFFATFIVMYGIYTGKFSPTEASGVTAAYCLLAGLFLTRKIKLRNLPKIMLRSALVNGLLAPIIAISIVMQQILSVIGAKAAITDFVTSLGGYWVMLFAMMFIIIIGGTIMESIPDTIILAPILAPIAHSIGINPIHFACIFLMGDAVGFITPPYGLNLYVASGITGIPYFRLLRFVVPFLIAIGVVWVLVAIFPFLSLWIPNMAMPAG